MKTPTVTAFLLGVALVLTVPATTLAQDLKKGLEAEKRGDYATALREWRPLAEKGNDEAQFRLGRLYYYGDAVSKNTREAIKWYFKAAQQGNINAQLQLGLLYDVGEDEVTQDWVKALHWYHKAAENGNAEAQYHLGDMYSNGKGTSQNLIVGYMWWSIAVANGNIPAQAARENAALSMEKSQIFEAEILALDCLRNKYKKC